MRKQFLYISYWFFSLFLIGTAQSFDPTTASTLPGTPTDLASTLKVVSFPANTADFERVIGIQSEEWQPVSSSPFNAGFSDKTYWFQLTLSNKNSTPANWLIEVPYPLLDKLLFYQPSAQGYEAIHTGDQVPYSQRPFAHRHFVFPIQLPANSEQTFYFNTHSRDTLHFPLRLWHPDDFHRNDRNVQLAYGLYFGSLIILIAMNLLALNTLRERRFLLLVATIFFYTLSHANLTGFTFEYLLSDWPAINKWLRPITISLTIYCATLFTKDYLETEKRSPLLYNLLNAIGWVCIFTIFFTTFLPFSSALKMILANTVLALLIFITASIVCTPLKFAPARYFLIAWSGLIISVCITILQAFNKIPSNTFTENSMALGALIVAVFLSYGLNSRVNNERKHKLLAQKDALKNERLARKEQERATQIELNAQKKEFESQQTIIAAKSESAAKSNFLATMSHEIRTPMNGVLGLTELLLETELSTKQKEYIQNIHKSGESLLAILNDILDFSKVEAKQIELEHTEFSLESLLDDIISIFSQEANEKKLHLCAVIHQNTPRKIVGDPTRLRQIILNFVSNAFKFTEHGEIIIRAYWELDELRIEVQDTGIGISKEHQNDLFELFSQADQSTTRRYGGTGLGLAICKGLVELMNGTIGVHSRPNHGSTFYCTVKSPETLKLKQPKPPNLQGKTIVIIDTNLPFIECIAEQVCYWGGTLEIHPDTKNLRKDALKNADLVICHQKYSNAIPKNTNAVIYLADFSKREGHPDRTVLQRPVMFSTLTNSIMHHLGKDQSNLMQDDEDKISFHNLKLLVAEDNTVNRMVIKGILNKLGIKPAFAENGLLAVRSVLGSHEPFDVIIMDCEMPEMDGYQATREIRQLEKEKGWDIKIIGLSAHAVMEREQMAYQAGMNLYMTKPIQIEDIKKVLLDIERGQLTAPVYEKKLKRN